MRMRCYISNLKQDGLRYLNNMISMKSGRLNAFLLMLWLTFAIRNR